MSNSILLNVDSYKASHYLQYPEGTEALSCYIESRGGEFQHNVFFGLQAFLKQTLLKPITRHDINEAQEIFHSHGLNFNRAGWQWIIDEHEGRLPLFIEAVAEGALIPNHNVLVQVQNTDTRCAWLTSYVETALLRAVWYPTTVATKSWHCKQLLQSYLEKTADDLSSLDFKLHDFGARGVSSNESAALGGCAHLVNFKGTDTLAATVFARRFYDEAMAGFSIPAAEHSTIISWGKEAEGQAYDNMLKQFSGKGKLLAVVSDSYDLWHAIDELWGRELKEQVMTNGGTLVIRPDSGEPVEVVCQTVHKLMHHFGYQVNQKGYKLLPPYIRVIQGDGISLTMIEAILKRLMSEGMSADNVSFGMGAELLQKVDRDTQCFAMKASAVCINGIWRDIYKAPLTDLSKRSKKGRLALITTDSGVETITKEALKGRTNLLQPVFQNGQLLREQSLADIRLKAQQGLAYHQDLSKEFS